MNEKNHAQWLTDFSLSSRVSADEAERMNEVIQALESRTGDITGSYQEVINEVCRRTGGVFRMIACSKSKLVAFWCSTAVRGSIDLDHWSHYCDNYASLDLEDMEHALHCKITITETCDWEKSFREASDDTD